MVCIEFRLKTRPAWVAKEYQSLPANAIDIDWNHSADFLCSIERDFYTASVITYALCLGVMKKDIHCQDTGMHVVMVPNL